MANRKLRTIRVGAVLYLWWVNHKHSVPRHGLVTSEGEGGCREVFTAFAEGFPGQPARILFPESNKHGPGFPRQRGVVVDYKLPNLYINLNRPRIARLLIELAIAGGWIPGQSRREFVIPDGYRLLRRHCPQLLEALQEKAPTRRRHG